jgi:hypothetical protein
VGDEHSATRSQQAAKNKSSKIGNESACFLDVVLSRCTISQLNPCGNALLSGTASGPGSGLIFEKTALSKWQLAVSKAKARPETGQLCSKLRGTRWGPTSIWDGLGWAFTNPLES